MVTEESLSRVVKALASSIGPDIRTKKWLRDFSGLEEPQINEVLKWLRSRNHVKLFKSGAVRLLPHARKTAIIMIRARMPGMLNQLDIHEHVDATNDHLARRIFTHYHECLLVRRPWDGHGVKYHIPHWPAQSDYVRRQFVRAAASAREAGAEKKPMEYVQAQFVRFDKVGEWRQAKLLPQPQHLAGPGAQTRFTEFAMELEERLARQAPKVKKTKKQDFSQEGRLLAALASFNNVGSDRILRSMPTQFTREFLQHMKVWEKVRDAWQAASDDL